MKIEDISLLKKGLLIISVPLVAELALVFALIGLIEQSNRDAAQVYWRQQITAEIDNLFRLTFDAFSTVVSYGMRRDENLAKHYDEVIVEIGRLKPEIVRLCAKDKDASARVKDAFPVLDDGLKMLQEIKDERAKGASNPLAHLNPLEKQSRLFKMIKQFKTLQHDLDDPLVKEEAQARRIHGRDRMRVIYVLAGGVFVNVALALALIIFLNKSISTRLMVIVDNSQRLASKQKLLAALPGLDEVAALDASFHKMSAALAASQEKQNEIINNSEDVICSVSMDGKFLLLNQSAERLWGRRAETLIQQPVHSIIDDPSEQLPAYFSKLRESSKTRPVSVSVVKPDGSRGDSLWSCHWSELDQCFFCVVHDNTAERERERLKERFVNVIGKQLKTPLETIQADLSVLASTAEGHLSDRGKKGLRDSLNSSDRIIRLVDELMELKKMEEGVLQMQFVRGSALETLKNALSGLQSFAEKKKIVLEANASDDLELEADHKRLIQVIVNMLSNAIKYSPSGGKVIVSAEVQGKEVVFSVIDEGPGIPQEALSSLFERFKRLEREVDKSVKGTGLGLSICKMFVEAHGGTVGVENNKDKGSRFWFSVPLTQENHTEVTA